MRFSGGRIGIDATFQPGAVAHVLEQAAKDQAVDPNRWALAVLRELREWSGQLTWCPQQPDMLVAAHGALGHPLLIHVFERGHRALGEIPRWAIPVLRTPNVTVAAHQLEPQATRRTARALAVSLVSRAAPAPPELVPLSYAVSGAGLIGVDELTNLLEIPLPDQDRLLPLPTGEQIEQIRQSLTLWPASRRAGVLAGAATSANPVQFADLMRNLWWVRSRAPNPLPTRWRDLIAIADRLVPVIHTTSPAPAQRPVPVSSGEASAPRRRRSGLEVARAAPRVGRTPGVAVPQMWPVPTESQLVNGVTRDGLRLQVATSATQLRSWGRVLHNCLGDFTSAVAAGRSWIIGIELDMEIIGCVEVEPGSRTVRQILGARNRPLAGSTKGAVLETFAVTGVIGRAGVR